jgi:hypothetical protein
MVDTKKPGEIKENISMLKKKFASKNVEQIASVEARRMMQWDRSETTLSDME